LDTTFAANYAGALSDAGRFGEALPLLERVLVLAEKTAVTLDIGNFSVIAAEASCAASDAARCELLVGQAAEALTPIRPRTHPVFGRIDMIRGQLAMLKKQPQEAREYLRKAHAALLATGRPEPRHVRVLTYLAEAELQSNDLDAALARAEEAVAMSRERDKEFPASERIGSALMALGKVQKARGNAVAARAAFAEAQTQLEIAVGKSSPKAEAARQLLASS
jgi:tetratricopeptide (TPR) repeat protein